MGRSGAPVIRSDFSAGVVRDVPRHMIPDNAVWLGQDVFIDQDGKLSKRGGTTQAINAPGSNTATNTIAAINSSSADAIKAIGCFNTQVVANDGFVFTPAAGAANVTVIDAGAQQFTQGSAGVPFNMLNNAIIPNYPVTTTSAVFFPMWGGGAATTPYTTTGTLAVTAGDTRITGFSGADTAAAQFAVGNYLMGVNTSTKQSVIFRIVAVNTGSAFVEVEPTPTATMTVPASSGFIQAIVGNQGTSLFGLLPCPIAAQCGASHQNRAVYANIYYGTSSSRVVRQPQRVWWSVLPTETMTTSGSGYTFDGFWYLGAPGLAAGNFVDVQGIDQVVSVVSYSDQALLVLGTGGAALIRGSLVTSTTTNPNIGAFTIQVVNQGVGCMSPLSVQRTPVGVLFATTEGVYLFDGQRLLNVMDDRIRNQWVSQVQAGTTILGSAYIHPNHYYLSTTTSSTGYLCNLSGFRWTTTTGLRIAGSSVRDLSNATRSYAINQLQVGVVDTSNLKVMKIDPIFAPSSANQTDFHTGSAVLAQIQTKTDPTVLFSTLGSSRLRAFTDPSLLKKFKHSEATVKLVGGAATATVTATPGVEAEEASQTPLTFSPASTVQVKRAQLYSPQIVSHALGYTIQTTGACDSFDLLAFETDVVPLNIRRTT